MSRAWWLGLALGTAVGCATVPPPEPASPSPPVETPEPASPQPSLEALTGRPEVLAVVEGTVISVEDLEAAIELRGGAARYPDRQRRQALLDELIQHRVTLLRALEEGYDQREDVVRAFDKILVNLYRREHLEEEALEVTPEAIETYYRENPERFLRPARSRLAMIFVELSPRLGEEGRARARSRVEQARREALELSVETKGFGPLAKGYSDDAATKYVGGVVGWLYPRQSAGYKWPEEALLSGLALQEVGEVSEIVTTDEGFYLWRLVEREEDRPLPLDRVRDGIAGILRKEMRAERRRAFAQELRHGFEVWTDYDRLDALPEVTTDPGPPPLPGG